MKKQSLLLLALATVLIMSGVAVATTTASGLLVTHFIDVGQGDAILIDYGTYEMLIDGGRGSNCASYIQTYVDGPLEVMVATHPDADHIGGLDDVLDSFDVEHIWLNRDTGGTQYDAFMDKVSVEGAQIHEAQRGDLITLSTLTFDILHPVLPLGSDKNDNSIVLRLSFGEVDFLFTGDVEKGAEASMVTSDLIDDIDILKVSHHGSDSSSTESFLGAAQPEVAICSAAKNNTYEHPTQEVLCRLHNAGATIYGTDVHGTILVVTNGTAYCVLPTNDEPPVVPDTLSDYTSIIDVEGRDTTNLSPTTYKVVINEFELSPPKKERGAEWVELYNPGDSSIDLAGWELSSTAYNKDWHNLSNSIGPGGYYVYVYPETSLENARGDPIQLKDRVGNIVDSTPGGLTDEYDDNRTWQRIPNGTDTDLLSDWDFQHETRKEFNN